MLALEGGILVEPSSGRVRSGVLVVDGQNIREVVDHAPRSARVIDCSGAVIMPGFVCGHTHLYSSLAVGMAPPEVPPENFQQILERVWWKLDRALDAEGVEVSALIGAIRAARAGVTTLVDHHASPSVIDGSLDLVGNAIERVGLRGVLCYEVSDRGGADEAVAGLAENDRFLRTLREKENAATEKGGSLLRGMVGAHAGFTLSHDSAVALADLAVKHDVGVHIHVAEDECDARHSMATGDASIVEWLDKYRLLSKRALLAHCVHVDDAGAEMIAASGAHVAHNPRSNMNNQVGYSRPGRFGDNVTLGTDGIGADMFAEAHTAFLAAREHRHEFDPLAALGKTWSFAAGAFDQGIGRFDPGCPADLVVLDYDPPTPLSGDNLFGHLLFGMSAANVRDVFVAGNEVLLDRTLVGIDEDEVMDRARTAAAKLWSRMS